VLCYVLATSKSLSSGDHVTHWCRWKLGERSSAARRGTVDGMVHASERQMGHTDTVRFNKFTLYILPQRVPSYYNRKRTYRLFKYVHLFA